MRKTAARGPAGPYTVERGIDRDTYHDGPRNLSDLWNARPYADVESPHQDADADLDAERPSSPVRGVMINEETVRNLISSVLKTAQGEGDDESADDRGEYEPGTEQFAAIAPFMDYIADLMQSYASRKELASALESSSFAGFEQIAKLVEMAEKAGFGYIDTKKDYKSLRHMVNAYGGLVLDPEKRMRFEAALKGARDAGLFNTNGFGIPYTAAPGKIGFKQNSKEWKVSDTIQQLQFYDPAEIAKIPEVRTKYVNYILDFVKGKDITEKMQEQLTGQGIVDIAQGRFNVKRLSAVMRFMTERPDTIQAAALMVGLMLKETLGKLDVEGHIGENGITISKNQIIRNMSESTKSLADRWIRSAVAILRMSGMMPEGEDYESARTKILQNAIRAAVKIATPLVSSMMRRFQTEQYAAEQAKRDKMQQMDVRQPAGQPTPQPEGQPAPQPEGRPLPPARKSSRDAELVNADVLKEITGPTKLRVVTPEEAEEGIEVGDERKLKFHRSRYHAVSEMLARRGGG